MSKRWLAVALLLLAGVSLGQSAPRRKLMVPASSIRVDNVTPCTDLQCAVDSDAISTAASMISVEGLAPCEDLQCALDDELISTNVKDILFSSDTASNADITTSGTQRTLMNWILNVAPDVPSPFSSLSFYPYRLTIFDPAVSPLLNSGGISPLLPYGTTCPGPGGTFPKCTQSKNNLGVFNITFNKTNMDQTGSGLSYVSNCMGPGDCIGMNLQQMFVGGAGQPGDEGATLLRMEMDDTYKLVPLISGLASNYDTLTAPQTTISLITNSNDAPRWIGEDALVVWGSNVGNCDDSDNNGTPDRSCYQVIDGSAGAAGFSSVTERGIWTVAQSSDLHAGVKYDPAIGWSGYCAELDKSARYNQLNGSGQTHKWWLPILFGPSDNIDLNAPDGVAVSDTFTNSNVDTGANTINVGSQPFGIVNAVKQVNFHDGGGGLPAPLKAANAAWPDGAPFGGYWLRVQFNTNLIKIYPSLTDALAGTNEIDFTTTGGAGPHTVGTGDSCNDPTGCSSTQFQTYFLKTDAYDADGYAANQGIPTYDYVPGRAIFYSPYVTGAAADDGVVAACEMVGNGVTYAKDALGNPQSGAVTVTLRASKPERKVTTSTTGTISYPPHNPGSKGMQILDVRERAGGPGGSIFAADLGGLDGWSAGVQHVFNITTRRAQMATGEAATGWTADYGFRLSGGLGTPSTPNYQPALIFWDERATQDIEVADSRPLLLRSTPSQQWGTSSADLVPLLSLQGNPAQNGSSQENLDYDTQKAIWHSSRSVGECSVLGSSPGSSTLGMPCNVNADCGSGGSPTCQTTSRVQTFAQVQNAASNNYGISYWTRGPTCAEVCQRHGLACVDAVDRATGSDSSCTASPSGVGLSCDCEGAR